MKRKPPSLSSVVYKQKEKKYSLQDERIVIEALHQIVVELELQIRLNKNII